MHEKFEEVCKNCSIVENAGGLHFSAEDELVQAFGRRSALRESLLSLWKVDINQALRVCEGRQVQVEALEASFVSVDRVGDPWPSQTWCELVGLLLSPSFLPVKTAVSPRLLLKISSECACTFF